MFCSLYHLSNLADSILQYIRRHKEAVWSHRIIPAIITRLWCLETVWLKCYPSLSGNLLFWIRQSSRKWLEIPKLSRSMFVWLPGQNMTKEMFNIGIHLWRKFFERPCAGFCFSHTTSPLEPTGLQQDRQTADMVMWHFVLSLKSEPFRHHCWWITCWNRKIRSTYWRTNLWVRGV